MPSDRDLKVTASDAPEFEPVAPEPPKRRLGWKVFVFLVVAGAGAWSYYGDQLKQLWRGGQGDIPLIKADPGPIKVRPESPGGLRVPDRDKLVYDRIQGKPPKGGEGEGPSEDRGPERLLPPPEQPLPKPTAAKPKSLKAETLAGKTQPKPQPKPKTKPVAKVPTIKDVKTAKRPAPPPPPPAPPAAPKTTSPVVAAAKRLSKPKAETQASAAKQTPTAKKQPPEPKPPASAPTPTVSPAKPPPTVPAAPKKTAAKTPDPQPKPETKPGPIPKSRAYLVQLAAARSPQGARTEWTRLRSKHLDLLGDLGLTVTKADLGPARGIYYRLRAGPISDEAEARRLCKRLAERQVGCLIIKPDK